MNYLKPKIIIIGFVWLLLLLAQSAWAGAGEGGLYECCVVTNPGNGALALKGSWALELIPDEGAPFGKRIDVKLRLERSGQFEFFEFTLKENVADLTNEEIACRILNPEEPGQSDPITTPERVVALVDWILETFFPKKGLNSENTKLVITRDSVRFTDGPAGAPIYETPGDATTDPTGIVVSIGDIIIYAVDANDVKYEPDLNSACFPAP